MLKGVCGSMLVGQRELAPSCKGLLMNTSFSDGRSGFYFVSDEGALTFSGDGRKQVKPDPDRAIQPVDLVLFTSGGKTQKLKAVGSCTFANPYKGPVDIVCIADTEERNFVGKFRTDGNAPDVKKMGR